MSVRSERLEINPCPLCNRGHVYMLEVERSVIFNYAIGSASTVKERKFVRFFVCGDKNGRFQAEVTLEEEPGEKIRDVRVAESNDG